MPNASLKSLIYALTDQKKLLERDALLDCADQVLEASGQAAEWKQQPVDTWMYFRRKGSPLPDQGWKLHISATPLSAESVLKAVLPLLFNAGCAFKMVRTKRLLMSLNDANSARASAGKFITIYPADDAESVRLAEMCHSATSTLTGPAILSDRRYRPGSLVHYRYGGFSRQTIYGPDARIIHVIRGPDGRPVPDAREAWFALPAWLKDPFQPPAPVERNAPSEPPSTVLVGGRYEVTQALRHANKGGVYLATDRQTGEVVILKEARPGVGMDSYGRDVVARLRVEARNLERLSALGVAPRLLNLFEDGGHLFIAMEKLEGSNLRQTRRAYLAAFPANELQSLAQSIASLLKVCHEAGLVIRDFNPNNLMILPGGIPKIIDVEMACEEGDPLPVAVGGFTPGYGSPEQRAGEIPRRTDDCYSLAATLYFLAAGRDPYLIPDTPASRTHHERITELLDGMIRSGDVPAALREPILGGMAAAPTARWSAGQVLSHLTLHAAEMSAAAVPLAEERRNSTQQGERERYLTVTSDLIAATLGAIHFENEARPVDGSCTSQMFDPACVQHGAAGSGSFLVSTFPLLDEAGRGTLARLAAWVAEDSRQPIQRPQGLYFGAAGAAWFLLDAAEVLGDTALRARACEMARSLQPLPALVDVTHGASGIGLTLLHFYQVTREPGFLEGAMRLGDAILAREVKHAGGVIWPQPDSTTGSLISFYGFAHGVAGIAYFSLLLWAASKEERFLAASQRCGKTLLQAVHRDGDRAFWPHGPDRPTLWTYWCNGSSGVATTLVRLYHATGEDSYREAAEQAANAIYAGRWFSAFGQCHGLAGNGECLLDLHWVLGGERYLAMAQELADVLLSHRVYQNGRIVFSDDSGTMVSPDFAVGWSGAGAFFHRLATGGPRSFMVDELLGLSMHRAPQAGSLAGVRRN